MWVRKRSIRPSVYIRACDTEREREKKREVIRAHVRVCGVGWEWVIYIYIYTFSWKGNCQSRKILYGVLRSSGRFQAHMKEVQGQRLYIDMSQCHAFLERDISRAGNYHVEEIRKWGKNSQKQPGAWPTSREIYNYVLPSREVNSWTSHCKICAREKPELTLQMIAVDSSTKVVITWWSNTFS